MAALSPTVQVEGLRELQRAFKLADKTLARELRVELRRAAEPVRADAEGLAVFEIPTIGLPWSRMRVGVTQTTVYVAPKQRGRHTLPSRRRPNLKNLLLDRAMIPSLKRNEEDVVEAVDDLLGRVGRAWETA